MKIDVTSLTLDIVPMEFDAKLISIPSFHEYQQRAKRKRRLYESEHSE